MHTLCWTPAPPNLNISAHVLAKVMLGGWFFSSIGANAPRVTLTLNFGGKGVVSDRKGLNISPIYSGTNWGVRHAAHPSWYRLALWCFHVFWYPNFYCGNICLHAADLIPNCAKHYLFAVNATCLPPVPCFLLLDVLLIAKYAKH